MSRLWCIITYQLCWWMLSFDYLEGSLFLVSRTSRGFATRPFVKDKFITELRLGCTRGYTHFQPVWNSTRYVNGTLPAITLASWWTRWKGITTIEKLTELNCNWVLHCSRMKRLTDHYWANTVFVLRSVLLQLDAHFVRSAIEFGNNTINSLLVL